MTDQGNTTILHVITALNYGGAEAMLAKLVLAARDSRQQRHVIVSMLPLGVVGQDLAARGIPVHTLGMTRGRPSLRAAIHLLRLVHRLRPGVIQGWMYHGNIAASLAWLLGPRQALLGWNVRHSLHDPSREERGTAMAIRLCARLSRLPAFTIFNSRIAIAEHAAAGFDIRSALLVSNGFDTGFFRPDSPTRPIRATLIASLGIAPAALVIGMVARVHPMKDHATLAAAVRRVREAGHDVHLVLAGAGTDELAESPDGPLAALPPDRVSLLGDRRDLAQWLPGLDVAVLSSAWGEGFPNAIGEAMAAGVPCVVTDVGDSGEIVGNGGLCVPPGDPAALAAALIQLIEAGPQTRSAIGAVGRERVQERYTIDAVAARYGEIYRGQIERRGRPAGRFAARANASCAG